MKYLTLTIIFNGQNLNYGESSGNVLSLKKVTQENREWSYISRQAIRYDLVRLMEEMGGYQRTDKIDKVKGVVQFTDAARIGDSPEIDFFGYMKTESKKGKAKEGDDESQEDASNKTKIRKAIVRLSDGISLEPFSNDLDFSTNMGMGNRIPNKPENDIFQSEFHKSLYTYTLTIDLDKVGEDENYKESLSKSEKIKRLNALLNAVENLYRDIRGKRENLSPIFAIGGIYEWGNPFFYNLIKVQYKKDQTNLDTASLNDVLAKTVGGSELNSQTSYGVLPNVFSNVEDLTCNKKGISAFFNDLRKDIESTIV